ncbi:MAG: hypothetical protein RBT67_06055, partial [Thauera sp.]|nr:hypothetical protein [Thauera sp.]
RTTCAARRSRATPRVSAQWPERNTEHACMRASDQNFGCSADLSGGQGVSVYMQVAQEDKA